MALDAGHDVVEEVGVGRLLKRADHIVRVRVEVLVDLLCADRLRRLLGERTMIAFERLMGLILTAMSVEMLLAGLHDFIKTL